jgi:hypothetical protein
MPILSRTQTSVPLPVEGEYAGIARKVSFSYSQEGVGTMRVPLYDPWGRLIATATLLDTDKARWTYGGLIKSGELQIPDGIENFTIDASDVEGLVFYFQVNHYTRKDGLKGASVKFHSKSYACRINPALENLKFPGARTPGVLRAAAPAPVLPDVAALPAPVPAASPAPPVPPATVPALAPVIDQPVAPPTAPAAPNLLAGMSEEAILRALAELQKQRPQTPGE